MQPQASGRGRQSPHGCLWQSSSARLYFSHVLHSHQHQRTAEWLSLRTGPLQEWPTLGLEMFRRCSFCNCLCLIRQRCIRLPQDPVARSCKRCVGGRTRILRHRSCSSQAQSPHKVGAHSKTIIHPAQHDHRRPRGRLPDDLGAMRSLSIKSCVFTIHEEMRSENSALANASSQGLPVTQVLSLDISAPNTSSL